MCSSDLIISQLENNKIISSFFLEKGILKKKSKNSLISVTYLPKNLVPFALSLFHFKNHSGWKKLIAQIRPLYWWPKMAADCLEFSKGCVLCSIFKSTNVGKSQFGIPRSVPAPRHTWQIDIVSGLPPVRGCTSYLNCVDMYSGFTLPIPLKSETSETIAMLIESYIFKVFGPPACISSDNAANLAGPAVQKLFAFYKVQHHKTVPYSPQSHGLVENANKYVTQLLKIFSSQYKNTWLDVLNLAAIVINSTPRTILKDFTPFFLMFGSHPNDPAIDIERSLDVENLAHDVQNNVTFARLIRELLLKKRKELNSKRNLKYRTYPAGTLIYVKNQAIAKNRKMKNAYLRTPFKVIKEYFATLYCMDIMGRVHKISKDNVKRCEIGRAHV